MRRSGAVRFPVLGGELLAFVGPVRMYVCGITPYDTTHLGHAATFVWADVARRVFEASGAEVRVCRNITDVDDDLLREARRLGEDWRALAARQTYRFEDDMRALGVAPPTYEPLAHNYVDEVVALGEALVQQGRAYVAEGSVFFRGSGVRSGVGLGRDQAITLAAAHGDRPDQVGKDDPLDVPVWQRSDDGEPAWPSPWGPGRPGWHAECAAMALATLGPGVDVHAGGADLAFPHHAYEAALAEAAVGVRPFARSWMHVGTVMVDGHKMAKSAGNLVLVHDLLDQWSPGAIRLMILEQPWGESWAFDAERLAKAEDHLERLKHWGGRTTRDEAAEEAALDALRSDLDVVRALDVASEAGGETLHRIGALLGLL